jgi:hypothetical protein
LPIEAKAREITEGIESLGCEIIGDLSSLAKASYGENDIPTSISIESLVDPILSRTRAATLDSISSKDLLFLVFRRGFRSLRNKAARALGRKAEEV